MKHNRRNEQRSRISWTARVQLSAGLHPLSTDRDNRYPRAMVPPKLPRGLDPVTAGRFGLWLLGKRQHMRARRRNSCPATYAPRSIVDRVVALVWRWTVAEYPGMHRGLGDLLGLTAGSARHLMAGRRPL